MRKISALLCLVLPTVVSVQAQSYAKRQPIAAPPGYFASLGATPQHLVTSRLSAGTNAALLETGNARIVSLPHFTRSFSSSGEPYSFTMVGQAPTANQTTTIPTSYVPLSLSFDEYVDGNGNNITIDATTITNEITRSPLFENAEYATGTTQFVDAQMRAEFWAQINKARNDDFHVLLSRPQSLTPVTIEVPYGSAVVYALQDGTYFALIDINFLVSQINTLYQTEPITVTSIPIFLTRNAVFGDFAGQAPIDCCIGGYHTAFETYQVGNRVFVQTAAFATALDPGVADGIFQDPAVFADINALSHEMAETLNDPFGNNVTPEYQLPGQAPGVCSDLLEVGDVVEGLSPDSTEVTLHGFTYHPQTLGLVQWFEGVQPSNAIDAAYSFPDTTKLTSPFAPCGIQVAE